MPARQLLTAAQAAEHLNTTRQRLYQWRRAGKGPDFIVLTGRYYYFIDGLESWLADNSLLPRMPQAETVPALTPEDRPLTDDEWSKLNSIVRPMRGQEESTRAFIDGVLHLVWHARPWHMLPANFGNAQAIMKRFHDWSYRGLWHEVFTLLSADPDFPYRYVQRDSICANKSNYNGKMIHSGFLDVSQRTLGDVQVAFRAMRRPTRRKWSKIAP